MITAAEFEENYGSSYRTDTDMMEAYAIMKAKCYVQEALKAAAEKAIDENMVDNCNDHTPYWGSCQNCGRSDNFKRLTTNTKAIKESILNAYPLDNIK